MTTIKIELPAYGSFEKKWNAESKEIADKIREAVGVALRHGHTGTAEWLDRLANEIQKPNFSSTESWAFKELIGVRA
jgi:hypothetical protein